MAQSQMYWAFVVVPTNFINSQLCNLGVREEAPSGVPPPEVKGGQFTQLLH